MRLEHARHTHTEENLYRQVVGNAMQGCVKIWVFLSPGQEKDIQPEVCVYSNQNRRIEDKI